MQVNTAKTASNNNTVIQSSSKMTSQSDNMKSVQHSSLYDVKLPFPYKLHDLLDDAEMQGYESIISWLPHGKAFRVHRPKAFAATIMLKYFKQSKYKSFQRQLHIYGFLRINSRDMKDYGAYYHPTFLRGKRDDTLTMQRQPSSSKMSKERVHPISDPDFYSHEFMPTKRSGSLNEEWGSKISSSFLNCSNSFVFQKSNEANGNVHIIPEYQQQQQQMTVPQVSPSALTLLANLNNAGTQGSSFQSTGCSSSSCFSASSGADLQHLLLPLSNAPPMMQAAALPTTVASSAASSSLLGRNISQAQAILSQMYGRSTTATENIPENAFSSIISQTIPSDLDRPASPFTEACNELFED